MLRWISGQKDKAAAHRGKKKKKTKRRARHGYEAETRYRGNSLQGWREIDRRKGACGAF